MNIKDGYAVYNCKLDQWYRSEPERYSNCLPQAIESWGDELQFVFYPEAILQEQFTLYFRKRGFIVHDLQIVPVRFAGDDCDPLIEEIDWFGAFPIEELL